MNPPLKLICYTLQAKIHHQISFIIYLSIFFCFLLFYTTVSCGQNPNCYRITFSDKNDTPYAIERPDEFLSPRAIAKRERFNIPIKIQDLPVNPHYIDSVLNFSNVPSQIISKSKWDNSVVIFYPDTENCRSIIGKMLSHFSFVVDTLPVAYFKLPIAPSFLTYSQTLSPFVYSSSSCDYDYGKSIDHIKLHKGESLHKAGFCGEEMLICVIDAGWEGFDTISYFKHLYENGQIWGTRDFIPEVNNVYLGTGAGHGTAVTSMMASAIEGQLIGSAPKANYFFLRIDSPWGKLNLVEEDFWAFAAEIADSLGADIVNSSVGFQDKVGYEWQNIYTPDNNDGISSISSSAASLLAQKGVITVQAAGNAGNEKWHYICRPADAFNILTVGGTYKNGVATNYSSYGPTADGRIKPDVAALSSSVWGITAQGKIWYGDGHTSAAAPIIAGLSACLWQALPQYSSIELMDFIRSYGDRANNPDDRTGYGVPNFYQCYLDHYIGIQEKKMPSVLVYPNPTTREIQITSYELQVMKVEVLDIYGRKQKVECNSYDLTPESSSGVISYSLSNLSAGIYFVQIQTEKGKLIKKIVKY